MECSTHLSQILTDHCPSAVNDPTFPLPLTWHSAGSPPILQTPFNLQNHHTPVPFVTMATLLPSLSSDEETEVKLETQDDNNEESEDEVDDEFEFGGILVCDSYSFAW